MNVYERQEWIDRAQHDIDTVNLLLKEKGHPDVIVYHIHQAVEKLLKALILGNGGKIEKTHQIDKLFDAIISTTPDLERYKEHILKIHLYLPKCRYPYGDVITEEEAKNLSIIFYELCKVLLNNIQATNP